MKMPRYQAAGIRRNSPVRPLKKGEVLGRICDYFGRELFVYRAKNGWYYSLSDHQSVHYEDTPMVSYGTWDEDRVRLK